jgi:hypothetical protein
MGETVFGNHGTGNGERQFKDFFLIHHNRIFSAEISITDTVQNRALKPGEMYSMEESSPPHGASPWHGRVIACFQMFAEKFTSSDDEPEALPRCCGAPVAMTLYYLYRIMPNIPVWVMQRYRNAPPPPTGQGWRMGGENMSMKKGFLQSKKRTIPSPITNRQAKFPAHL